jgi:hypothetical protein
MQLGNLNQLGYLSWVMEEFVTFSISTLHTPHLGAFIWLQYLNFRPLCTSHQFPAFICLVSNTSGLLIFFCMYLNLILMSKFPPLISQQFLAFIWLKISNFPPIPLIKFPKFPAFIGFQYLYFPRSLPLISCLHFI